MSVVSITQAPDVRGLTVLLRTSLNVPVANGEVVNPFRLARALETITYLRFHGAKVVLISHIGDGPEASLTPVYNHLKKTIPLTFVEDIVGEHARKAVAGMKNGDLVMLENLRRDSGEKDNDEDFARKLASLADIYVNDDFAVAHRKHASVVGVPKFLPSYAGLQFMAEVKGLTPALEPKSPSLAIIGGAKFVTKEPLIRQLLEKYDHVFIGGALANDFLKAKGYEVGRSLVSDIGDAKDMLKNSKVILPVDVTVLGVDGRDVKVPNEVLSTEIIYDVGPMTIAHLGPLVSKAKTILWNGPLGNFEHGFREMTEALARMVANSAGDSVVGGGDTIAAIQRLKIENEFSFTSTAGGAMLDFLAHGSLPGIEALEKSKRPT